MSFKRWRRDRQLGKVRPGDGSALVDFRFRDLFGSRSLFYIRLVDAELDGSSAGRETEQRGHVYAIDVRHYADNISRKENVAPAEAADERAEAADERSEKTDRQAWLKDLVGERIIDEILGNDEEGDTAGTEEKPAQPPSALYRDGVQIARSNLPAAFPVPGGVIEAARSSYGLTRMHYVPESGESAERMLRPHRRSPEGIRARIARRFPKLSRFVGGLAIVVLLIGLVTGIPQGIQMISEIPPIADRVGTFTSPFQFPEWLNVTLLVAGILAAIERALMLKNHWLIDLDTTWSAFD